MRLLLRRFLLSWRACLTLSVLCVLWSEFLALRFQSWFSWDEMKEGDPSTRILIVADPQLIGYQNEPRGVGAIARWDSDRYLSAGYNTVHSFVKPDLVIFLGDLLDEGVEGNNREHVWTVERFRKIFQLGKVPEQYHFTSGDNDVGGEGEYVLPRLVERFEKEMQSTLDMENLGMSSVAVKELNGFSMKLRSLFSPQNSTHRILLCHSPVLKSWTSAPKIATLMNADLILSGHDHTAAFYLRDRQSELVRIFPYERNMKGPIRTRLGGSEPLIELQTPTCSYRMGVPNMGYGFLKMRKSGSTDLDISFTILWVPGRYRQLYAYIIILIWWIILLLFHAAISYRINRRRYQKVSIY